MTFFKFLSIDIFMRCLHLLLEDKARWKLRGCLDVRLGFSVVAPPQTKDSHFYTLVALK